MYFTDFCFRFIHASMYLVRKYAFEFLIQLYDSFLFIVYLGEDPKGDYFELILLF